jgi:hypothetical protein
MLRIFMTLAACLVLVSPLSAEEPYSPKRNERVDWEKVFSGKGLLDEEEDYSEVLGRDKRKERIDWKREAGGKAEEAVQPAKEANPAGAAAPQAETGGEAGSDAPEIRYSIHSPDSPQKKSRRSSTKLEKDEPEENAGEQVREETMKELREEKSVREFREETVQEVREEDITEAGEEGRQESEPLPAQALPAPKPEPEQERIAVLESRPEPEPEPEPEPKRLFSDEAIDHFLNIAFYDKDEQAAHRQGGASPRAKVLTRWEKDLAVSVKGVASERERDMLGDVLKAMDEVVSSVSDVNIRMGDDRANVAVFFLPAREGEELSGFVENTYEGAEVVRSNVVFYSGRADKPDMMRQFMHVLGFIGTAERRGDTVMSPEAEAGNVSELPSGDAKALKMLYRSSFEPGMHLEEVKESLSTAYAY